MKTNSNWKKRGFEDYDYMPHKKNQIKYNKYKLKKYHKNNQLIENNIKDLKNDENQEIQHPINLINIEDTASFYPKNYKKEKSQYPKNNTNNVSHHNDFTFNNNKDFFSAENSNFYNNKKKNENETYSLNHNIVIFDEKEKISEEYKLEDKDNIENQKKIGIKNIPYPKQKKLQEAYFIPRKKMSFYHNKKNEENNLIKERKLSFKNNFDSAKHSISTLNSSSSSCKEKAFLNDNQISRFNFANNYPYNKFIKNKFENNSEIPINQNIDNTEILNVNIKISKNKNIVFKLRRFDDVFFTVKIFCKINSIDEKLIKPIIIKIFLTLNIVYRVMNCNISPECISLLKEIKNIIEFEC